MSGIGQKRARDENEEFEPSKKLRTESGSSWFQLPELIQNTIKYLLKYPENILRIASVSKTHYNVIRSTATWKKLGFSTMISDGEKLSEETLKLMLAQIRLNNDNQKLLRLTKRIDDLENICNNSHPKLSVDLEAEELPQFISNNYLTDEAAIALLRIIERTLIRSFSLIELVEWLERDPQPSVKIRQDWTSLKKSLKFKGYGYLTVEMQRYNHHTVNPNEMQHILFVTRDEESVEYYGHVKRQLLATDKKTILLIYSSLRPSRETIVSFIKFDRSNKVLECCGELSLFVAKKFEGNFENAMKYLLEVDEVDTNSWADYEMSPDDEDEIEKNYSKCVAENVPFIRSID